MGSGGAVSHVNATYADPAMLSFCLYASLLSEVSADLHIFCSNNSCLSWNATLRSTNTTMLLAGTSRELSSSLLERPMIMCHDEIDCINNRILLASAVSPVLQNLLLHNETVKSNLTMFERPAMRHAPF